MRVLSAALIVFAFVLGGAGASWWIRRQPLPDSSSRNAGAAPKMTLPAGQPVVGFLDVVDDKPVLTAKADADILVSGWAACAERDSPLVKVEILVDQKTIASAAPAYARPDVAEAYDRPDFENSGWRSSLPLRNIEAGDHELTARATCASGETGLLPPFRLVVTR